MKLLTKTLLTLAITTSGYMNQTIASNDKLAKVEVATLSESTVSVDESLEYKRQLIDKLIPIKFFTASFKQQVIDEEGKVLQNGGGKLSVKKPNLVHWQTIIPDESLIVSDGNVLWFYDPFIEQATAYTLDNVIANTPVLLLTSDDDSLWQHFSVSKINEQTFLVHANDVNSQVKTLELSFSATKNHLTGFTILDATGQLSHISLTDVDYQTVPDASLFNFVLPDGAYLDDQR